MLAWQIYISFSLAVFFCVLLVVYTILQLLHLKKNRNTDTKAIEKLLYLQRAIAQTINKLRQESSVDAREQVQCLGKQLNISDEILLCLNLILKELDIYDEKQNIKNNKVTRRIKEVSRRKRKAVKKQVSEKEQVVDTKTITQLINIGSLQLPTSTWVHISTVADELHLQRPKTVLDIGIGFGRWGLISREILDVIQARIFKEDWKTRIDGVEIFEKYITPVQRHLYDEIFIGDAYKQVLSFQKVNKTYDCIIAGDVVEHYKKEDAKKLIDVLYSLSNKCLIIGIPIGDKYPQGTVAGNVYETHRSIWTEEEFKKDKRVTKTLFFKERVRKRPYGLIIYGK